MTDTLHPSHVTRGSDASSFDEICVNCGATDLTCGGWGKLAEPCPKPTEDSTMTELNPEVKKLIQQWLSGKTTGGNIHSFMKIIIDLAGQVDALSASAWRPASQKPEKDQQDELYNKDHELYNKKLEYREIAWADMKPDLYAGENCDEALPQWEAYFGGDKGSETGLKEIDFAASNFPPGTRIIISVPLCPKCSTDEEAHDSEICDFDWALWRDHNYS